MEVATIAAIGKAMAPIVIKCGELVFQRHASNIVANVTEEGCAALGRKTGGDGILGRIGECSGRAIGWVAGLFVSQSDGVKDAIDVGANYLSGQATAALLGVASKTAEHVVTKVVDRYTTNADGESVPANSTDEKIKKQKLKNLQQKGFNKQVKGEILLMDLDIKRMEAEAKKLKLEAMRSNFVNVNPKDLEEYKVRIEARRAVFASMLSGEGACVPA